MKAIFITREGYRLPGSRIRCYNFARELAKYDIDAGVFSYADELGAKDGERESRMGFFARARLNYSAFRRLCRDRKAVFYLQRFNYHSFAPCLAHLINGNPMVLDLDDWEMREDPRYYFGFYPSSKAHYLTRLIARRSIFCVAASRFLEGFLKGFNKNTYYLPSGVDTRAFDPGLNKEDERRVVFSWIGTFHKKEYVENIAYALECFARLRRRHPHIYFEIAGDGIYKKEVSAQIESAGGENVLLRPWIEPGDIPRYLSSVHAGLFPVLRATKFNLAKSPTKLFEYMAMAKPTVASAVGEAACIIRDGENGLLARSKEEFTDRMERLIIQAPLRRRLGDSARATVESKYSLSVLGEQLSEIFKTHCG